MPASRDIVRTWRSPRAVMRDLLGMGIREDRALAYLMTGCLLVFMAQWPRLSREAHFDPSIPVDARIQEALLGWVIIAPLAFYLIAFVIYLIMRLFRSNAGAYSVRLALFWTLLATAPAMLLYGLTMGFVGDGPAANLTGAIWMGGFLIILIQCLREAGRQTAHV